MADISNLLKAAQETTSQYQFNEPEPVSEGFFADLAGGAIEAARSGAADIPRILQKVTDALSNAFASKGVPTDRLIIFKQLANVIEPKDFEDQATLTRKIGRVFGGLMVAVPEYAAATAAMGPLGLGAAAAIPAMAGVDAAIAWGRNEPPEQIGKAALGGAAFGTLLGPVGSKLGRWPGAGVVGGGATALAAIEGETKPEDLALTGLTMTTLRALGGRLPRPLQSKLDKLDYPREVSNKLLIKDAREIAKNNQKFVPPEPITTPVPATPSVVPPTSFADLRALLNKEQTSQVDAIKNSDLIYDKILLGKGFNEQQIASMSLETKLAIGNSGHNSTTIKVEPISGRITLTGKSPEITKMAGGGSLAEAEQIKPYSGKLGPSVEDLVVDPTKLENLVNATKDVTSKIIIGPEIPEEIVKEIPPKPVINKELVDQLKWKYGITPTDAKKSAILLAEKGIVIPSDATAFFKSIPKLPEGQKLSEHILKQAPEAKVIEETKAEKQLAIETAKFDARQLEDIQSKIAKAGIRLAILEKKEKLEKTAINKSVLAKVKNDIKNTNIILNNLNEEKNAIINKTEAAKPTNIRAAITRTSKEMAEADARIAALDAEIAAKPTVAAKSRKKVTVKELEKETLKAGIRTPEEINREHLIGKASVWWPNRRADLVLLSDSDLKRIVDETILPQKASITPSGKLVEMSLGDKALATILDTTGDEGTKLRAAIEAESPRTPEGLLRAAAEFMDVPYKTVAALSDIDKQNVIRTYLQHVDQNVGKAQKIGKVIEKGEVEATKVYNEIIPKNPDMDPALAQLKRKYTNINRKVKVATVKYKDGLIDKADLDLLLNSKTETLKTIEKRRNELKKKVDAPLKNGDSLFVASLTKNDNGGVVVIKKISNNIDEFQLLTKIGQSPIPGDTGLNIAGRVTIEKSLDGKPIKIDFPDTLDIPQQDFFKEQFKNAIQRHYEKQGFGTPEKGGIKLRTGIDIDLAKEIASRLKQKTINIYQSFAARQGPNKRIPKEEMPSVMKDMMDAEKLRLSEAEIDAMHAESMGGGITKMPTGWTVPGIGTTGGTIPSTPSNTPVVAPGMPAPGGIPKGNVPMVAYIDMLGQSMVNKNPDIRFVAEKAVQNEWRKRYLKEKLVYGDDSRLNAIFKKINEQPNAQELREQVAESFMHDTIPSNPLLLEGKNNIRSFLDAFGDMNNLRERGFFINKYFPLIADMDNTYIKIKGMFANIDNNVAADPVNNPRGLPSRYIEAGKSALSNEEFLELKNIFAKNKTWKELSPTEKNRIRYALGFEGIYDQWAFLPSNIMERTNSKTFNPHLQERTGGALLSYKHDAQEVLKQYICTMINKESDAIFKQEVMPVVNKYPRGDIFRSVRWYMERQVKQALGSKTVGDRWLSQEVERLNNAIGEEVLNPNFPAMLASRLTGQVAKGAIGPDTSLRNALQSMQTLVYEGPGKFAKGLHSYLEYLRGKGDPETRKWFDLMLGAEEYYEEVGPKGRTLKERWKKAESAPGKALAFYDWLGDMAMSPMRATEHFNKFLAFQTALSEAGEKGWSFEKGVRLGLLKSMDMVPDLEIPEAYYNAFKAVVPSQYGYSKTMRSPLTRGPLAKLSTIFWSYPANTVQFITRGLTEGMAQGGKEGMWKTTRFALYIGFQVSIAAAMAQLGIDVASIFGLGLLPVKPLSVPWEIMKNSYVATFGKTAQDRSSGVDDLLNGFGIALGPQFRYGKKVLKTVTDLERGYKAAGTRQLEVMEMSPYHAIMDLTGFPVIGPRKTYDLTQQISDKASEYRADKQELVLRGIRALEKGKMGDVQKVFKDATKRNIVLTYPELNKYYKIHKTITYLQSNLERLPKHLRPAMQKKVKELQEELMPHRFGKAEGTAGRSLWSAPSQYGESAEED